MTDIKEICEYALSELKKHGADDAQCRISVGSSTELNVDAGQFSLMRSVYNTSVSLTAIKDMKKGAVSINKSDKASIDAAVKECMENAEAAEYDDCLSIAPLAENKDFVCGVEEPEKDLFFDRICEYIEDVKRDYPKILIEQLIADYGTAYTCLGNTNGVRFTKKSGYYSLSSMYSAHDGDNSTSFNSMGFDFLSLDKPLIDYAMQREMYDMAQRELAATPFEGKFVGTAVFTPASVDEIIDSAVFSFASAGALIDGTSPWKDKLGQKVASDKLTFRLIPLDDRIICGERFTGEGYESENCTVIENGVLKSFVLGEYAARKTGNKRSSTQAGTSEIVAGSKPIKEIIAGIEQGILVCRISGGQPAGNGDFSAVAKNSFLIENGEITRPVTETMISGNLAQMLLDVRDISSQTVLDGGSVAPYAAFDGVTVSGQ